MLFVVAHVRLVKLKHVGEKCASMALFNNDSEQSKYYPSN